MGLGSNEVGASGSALAGDLAPASWVVVSDRFNTLGRECDSEFLDVGKSDDKGP